MSHLQKFTILFFCLFFSLFLACSKENVNNNDGGFPLQLTATQEGRNIKLNWTQTKVSTFEEYVVVRSTEPIPIDFIPTPFSQLVIKRLDEFEENEFTDNNPLLAERIYYKVFVDIGDRFLQSEERVVEYEVTILGGIPGKVAFNAATNMLYILNQETAEVLAYNYVTNESMGKVAAGTSFIDFQPGNNGSGEELYLVNSSNSVKIYDAFSMELKRTISPGSSLFMREVATNSNGQIYIYVDNFPNNVTVVNVENGAII